MSEIFPNSSTKSFVKKFPDFSEELMCQHFGRFYRNFPKHIFLVGLNPVLSTTYTVHQSRCEPLKLLDLYSEYCLFKLKGF